MKTTRGPKWVILLFLFLTIGFTTVAEAAGGFGTTYRHLIYGKRNSYKMTYHRRTIWTWYVDVPANTRKLQIDLGFDRHRGYGDVDLFLGYGFRPTTSRYSYRSIRSSYRENITIMNPRAGRWYIRLPGYSNYRTCMRIIRTPKATTSTYNWRSDMLNRVNSYRRRYSRSNLSRNFTLQKAAQDYAYDMARKHYYGGSDHHGSVYANYTMARRITGAGYRYWAIRENIAAGYTTVARVMNAWWASSGHRANILATDITQTGFGQYYSSDSSGRRWVQDFGRPR